MNDPATSEVWQTAFGKAFEEMVQCDNKQIWPERDKQDVCHVKGGNCTCTCCWIFFTSANPVVDFRLQNDAPYRIRITAGGNLLKYECNASVHIAGLDTAKMHWNSIVSTANARYMCLDI